MTGFKGLCPNCGYIPPCGVCGSARYVTRRGKVRCRACDNRHSCDAHTKSRAEDPARARKMEHDQYHRSPEKYRAYARAYRLRKKFKNSQAVVEAAAENHRAAVFAACRVHGTDYNAVISGDSSHAAGDARVTVIGWLVDEKGLKFKDASCFISPDGKR